VAFCASEPAARRITAVLLDRGEVEVDEDDIVDAMGEMANVIGGNLKSLLPGPSSLGLPIVVTSETGAGMRWPNSVASLYADLTWRGEPVTVTIWTATGSAARSASAEGSAS
jgi:chemotaxis protein CheX